MGRIVYTNDDSILPFDLKNTLVDTTFEVIHKKKFFKSSRFGSL
jgi:hypothetical protein